MTNYLKTLLCMALMTLVGATAKADVLDELERTLRDNPQVQEKIYVHTDNNTYFVGDTLWYKAYVVRADDLKPTDMSKLLYVELLSPDGFVVERQHVVVSDKVPACGQFVLQDSLYSGFYEIRAYTRWQLNFNVTHRDYTSDDRYRFYSKQTAKDFFREWDGLYSRVLPVYQKPQKEGDYVERYMSHRPKQHVQKQKEAIYVNFYPEGGSFVRGVPCHVAYEVVDQNGQQIPLEGTLSDGTRIKSQHWGRGQFTVVPEQKRAKATFVWNNKTYEFTLPKAQESGVALHYDAADSKVTIAAQGVQPAAYAILCRGALQDFQRMTDATQIAIDKGALPTGINEIIVYGADGGTLASRLFFVNHNDYGKRLAVSMKSGGDDVSKKTTIAPYAPIDLSLSLPQGAAQGGSLSLAVRDMQTDEPGYNTGNIMTDMLLSSELRGFIADPAYYFESDDAKHTADLDLLMAIQGWRRYKRVEEIRYQPETKLTYEGTVNKVPSIATITEQEDVMSLSSGTKTVADEMEAQLNKLNGTGESATSGIMGTTATEGEDGDADAMSTGMDSGSSEADNPADYSDDGIRLSTGRAAKNVLVEAELVKGKNTVGGITRVDKNGHFVFDLPFFYDKAILFVKAYHVRDSLTKNMSAKDDKGRLDDRAFPDYYVKRDMFFPVFCKPYSWYQINSPLLRFYDEDDEAIPEGSRLSGDHVLQNVIVKARRRGKRSIDMTKPAYVRDAYDLYNDATDYGLSWGILNFMDFPREVSMLLCGNMGSRNDYNIRALSSGSTFYRNYSPNVGEYDKPITPTAMFSRMRLNRLKDIRVFTDYELRTDSGYVVEEHSPAITLDFVPMPDDGQRYTYRDRRYYLDGLTYPEQFYSPDYSNAVPTTPTDYRRTLYWNPNVRVDEDGTFSVRFYNNARETRVTVSAEGMDGQGTVYY